MSDGSTPPELVIPLRISTDHVAEDLRKVDPEIARLEKRVNRAYNLSEPVRQGRAPRADSLGEVRTHLSGMAPSDLKAALLSMRGPMQALNERVSQLEGAARRGHTSVPPTAPQAEKLAAQARLAAAAQQRMPLAKRVLAQFDDQGADKFARALVRASPSRSAMRATVGTAGNITSILGGLFGLAGAEEGAGVLALLGLAGGGPLAVATAGAGLALTANQMQTSFQRQQAALASALVGGPAFGSPRALMGLAINATGQGLDFNSKTSQSIAAQLATAGVGKRDILGNLSNTLMLSGPNAIDPNQIVGLTSALATSGGMSNQQVNRTFQDVGNIAGDAGVSIQELIQSMKDLSKGATSAARDVSSLAAIQRILGPSSGILAGALMQPVMSSTGTQALQQAALLGLSPGAFLQAQTSRGGMAQVFDRISSLVKRTDQGPAGLFATESILQSSGLLNTQDLNPQQLARLLTQMKTASPQQAEKLAQKLYDQSGKQATSQADSYKKAAAAMDNLTSWTDRLSTAFQNFITEFLNYPTTGNPKRYPSSAPPHQGDVFRDGQWQHLVVRSTGQRMWMPDTSPPPRSTKGHLMIPNGKGSYNQVSAEQLQWYAQAAATYAPKIGVSTDQMLDILLAQGSLESGFNPKAVSKTGAEGIAQFEPATAKALGLKNPFDPKASIAMQALLDAQLYQQFGGNWQNALAAYNGGPGGYQGADAQAYGRAVYQASQQTQHEVHVEVTVKDDRATARVIGTSTRTRMGAKHHGSPPPYDPRRHMRR